MMVLLRVRMSALQVVVTLRSRPLRLRLMILRSIEDCLAYRVLFSAAITGLVPYGTGLLGGN